MCALTHSVCGVGEVVIPHTAFSVPPPTGQRTVTAGMMGVDGKSVTEKVLQQTDYLTYTTGLTTGTA